MPFNVVINAAANEDVLEAYRYYEKQQQGLGERFLSQLRKKYTALSLHPTHYGFIDEDPLKVLRDVRLEKFPYVIVFEIVENDVIVYAVHHLRKHPGNKPRSQ